MNPPPPPRPRRPLWTLVALPVLLVLPQPISLSLLAAGLAMSMALPALRRWRAHHPQPAVSVAPGDVRLGHERDARGRGLPGQPVVLQESQLSAHGLVVGASGSGKSTTLLRILTERIADGRPVVAIDMKGSPAFAAMLARAAQAAGRTLRVWTPDGPEHWNPLSYGNATELKDKLIATERFTEPHYKRAAERYAQLALQVLLERHPERPATLPEVVAALEPRRLAVLARELAPERRARIESYLSGLARDQLSAVQGLGTRLGVITDSHIAAYLEPGPGPDVDLRRALAGQEVVLFSLNSSVYKETAAQLGTLAIQDITSAVGHRLGGSLHGIPPQALVVVDEFSALDSDNVLSLIMRGREAGIAVVLATQELADLDRAGRGLRDQVLGNSTVKIFHRQDVAASAQAVAQMAGTRRVWEQSYTTGSDRGRRTRRVTQRQVEEFVVHPNEIKSLGVGEAVVITKVPQMEVRTVGISAPDLPRQPAADTTATAPRVLPSAPPAAPVRTPAPAQRAAAAAPAHRRVTARRATERTDGRGLTR